MRVILAADETYNAYKMYRFSLPCSIIETIIIRSLIEKIACGIGINNVRITAHADSPKVKAYPHNKPYLGWEQLSQPISTSETLYYIIYIYRGKICISPINHK